MSLTAERLQSLLHYNPETGELVWLQTRSHIVRGSIAGTFDKAGYRQVQIDGRLYKAHRLIWLYMTGEMPPLYIDHKDGDRSNNRWSNLRLADKSQNCMNRAATAKSGLKGVTQCSKSRRWIAQIKVNRRNICIGRFSTPEQASAAYMAAAREHFGEYARAK